MIQIKSDELNPIVLQVFLEAIESCATKMAQAIDASRRGRRPKNEELDPWKKNPQFREIQEIVMVLNRELLGIVKEECATQVKT